jgi:hypothetical protein
MSLLRNARCPFYNLKDKEKKKKKEETECDEVKLDERGGQNVRSPLPKSLFGNWVFNYGRRTLPMCRSAPSCWKVLTCP